MLLFLNVPNLKHRIIIIILLTDQPKIILLTAWTMKYQAAFSLCLSLAQIPNILRHLKVEVKIFQALKSVLSDCFSILRKIPIMLKIL